MRKTFLLALALLTSLLISLPANADEQSKAINYQAPAATIAKTNTTRRPTIALALGGGGIRGVALIGVLRVLEKEHIAINYISGCSMGAIIGGLYCAGVPLDQIENMFLNKSIQNAYACGNLPVRVCRYNLGKLKYIGRKERPSAGLFSGDAFLSFLSACLPANKENIEDLDIPFCAETTCLTDGQAYHLTHGDLCKAIMASSAIPPIIRPAAIDGKLFIDGSMHANTPVTAAKQFHADLVIAVPIDATLKPISNNLFRHTAGIAARMTDIFVNVVDIDQLKQADVIIRPEITDIKILSKQQSDIKKAIAAGEQAANLAIPAIRKALDERAVLSAL